MSQAISALAVGSLIDIYENGVIQLYEIAGFNVHGAGTATLVRKKIYLPATKFDTDTAQLYGGSDLDDAMQAFESKYTLQHRDALQSVSLTYATGTGTSAAVTRKVFAPSYTEVGGGTNLSVSENSALSLYSSNASRIKAVSDGGSVQGWWMRSLYTISTFRRFVQQSTGELSANAADTIGGEGLVPAFVLPSTTLVSNSTTAEGGYLPTFYADFTPEPPVLISPYNQYAYTDEAIDFEWQHVIDTGTPQTQADLEYSYVGGAWTSLATVTGSALTYSLPAGTLIPGNYRWRARTYNADGVAGEWSDPVAFVGVGATAAPTVSGVTAASRPTISWQSAGQAGYQLQIEQNGVELYDTDETAGYDKAVTLPFYLANGEYKARIRVISASRVWSTWSEYTFTLAVTPPDAPAITVEAITHGARITVTDDAGAVHLYLLRDGIPVAEITGLTEYDDYAGIGSVEYAVRGVDANENYADSSSAWVTVTVPAAALAAVDALDTVTAMSKTATGQAPVTGQTRYSGTGAHYTGRELPVYAIGEFKDETYSVTYFYTSIAEWLALKALLDRRKTLLYRDLLGNRFYCTGTAVNFSQDYDRTVFSLSLQRVDYVEEIEYAEVAA